MHCWIWNTVSINAYHAFGYDECIVNEMKPLYNKVIEQFPPDFGKAVSKRQREDEHLVSSALIYGEIDFVSFGTHFKLSIM